MNLAPVPAKETTARLGEGFGAGCLLCASITKNNYAPPQEPVYLLRTDGGYLTKANVHLRSMDPQDLEAKILALVEREADRGKTYTATQFEKAFGGATGALGAGLVRVRKALVALVNQGSLEKAGARGTLKLAAKRRSQK